MKKILAICALALLAPLAFSAQTSTNQPAVRRAELTDALRTGHNQIVVDIADLYARKVTNVTITLQSAVVTNGASSWTVVTNASLTVQK